MSHADAWYVALAGMGAILACLGATILLATVYGRLAGHLKTSRAAAAAQPVPEADLAPAARPDLPPSEPVPADVLAVIAAVLEVEKKLYFGRSGGRLTIRRAAPLR